MAVVFRICPLFQETAQEKMKTPGLDVKFKEFKASKEANPIGQYGSRDGMFAGGGNFTKEVPKLRHAHLTHDISILYRLSGANPTVIDLFGFFTHDDIGTGQPANIKKQKAAARRMAGQDFA